MTAYSYLSYNSTNYLVRLDTIASDGSKIKIIHTTGSDDIYIDGQYHSTITNTNTLNYIALMSRYIASSSPSNQYIKYKDFKVYPI